MPEHPLENAVALVIDAEVSTGWGGGLPKILTLEDPEIEAVTFDPRMVSLDEVNEAIDLGLLVGVRYDPAWDKNAAGKLPDPQVAAKRASDYIAQFEKDGERRIDYAEYDVETHDVHWQISFLLGDMVNGLPTKGIRGQGGQLPNAARPETLGYRWGRPFIYTFEPGQSPTTCAAGTAFRAGGKIGPQLYDKNMKARDMWWEIRAWHLGAKIPLESIRFFYSAAAPGERNGRPSWISQGVLFAASTCTELVG